MKTKNHLGLLLSLLMMAGPVRAQEPDPFEAETSVGDKSDVGESDPLNALENKNAIEAPPPSEPMPDFQDVDAQVDSPAPEINESAPTRSRARSEQVSAESLQSDDPDLSRERRFNDIYQKFNAQPTPLETWEQASSARTSEIYKVQRGDTLWDLSQTLFGDASYWPKVWALNNDEVTNPHEIETWMRIRFFPGDLNEAPTVSVAETMAGSPSTNQPSDGPIQMPPPRRTVPLITNLPKSLPLYKYTEVNIPKTVFEIDKGLPTMKTAPIAMSYFATADDLSDELFEVMETEMGGQTAAEFQFVFVNAPASGERVYTVVKDIGPLKAPGEGEVGRLIEVQGEIEVLDASPDTDGLARAIVRKNLVPIEVGSYLVPGKITYVDVSDATPIEGPETALIGGAFTNHRSMVDVGGFVFLNGEGLKTGMVLPVRPNTRMRQPKGDVLSTMRVIGHVKVVKVEGSVATGVMTKIWDDVSIGDFVGGVVGAGAGGSSSEEAASSGESSSDLSFEDESDSADSSGASEDSSGGEATDDEEELSLD